MKLLSIKTKVMYDEDPDASYLEQKGFEDRLRQYQNGVFGFVGVYAEAEIVDSNGVIQTVSSGGLSGIESDSGDEYMNQIKNEEVNELIEVLMKDYNISDETIQEIGITEDDA